MAQASLKDMIGPLLAVLVLIDGATERKPYGVSW